MIAKPSNRAPSAAGLSGSRRNRLPPAAPS